MSGLINAIKNKVHPEKQDVSIQPHPAKSNNPAEVEGSHGGNLSSNAGIQAHHARDPHVPSKEIQNKLEEPLDREALHARSAELNK